MNDDEKFAMRYWLYQQRKNRVHNLSWIVSFVLTYPVVLVAAGLEPYQPILTMVADRASEGTLATLLTELLIIAYLWVIAAGLLLPLRNRLKSRWGPEKEQYNLTPGDHR